MTNNDNPEVTKVTKQDEKLTFIDNVDPNPTVPSVEKSSIGKVEGLTDEQREDWTSQLQGVHQALVKKYAYARNCEINVKQGYDEQNDIDIWAPKKYKYHSVTVGEKHKLNSLNAEIANIERDLYKRLDVISEMLRTIKDASKLKAKLQEVVRDQQIADTRNVSYVDLVNKRIEYQRLAIELYYRVPEEIYNNSSVSDVALALDIAGFIEGNPYPLDHAIS